MNTVFHELIGVCVLSYIDDILIYSPTLEQHQTDVERVLQLLQRHKLYIKEYERNIFNVPEEELNQLLKYNVVNPHRLDGSRQKSKKFDCQLQDCQRISNDCP